MMRSLQEKFSLKTLKLKTTSPASLVQTQSADNTASTEEMELCPRSKLVYKIAFKVTKDTDSSLVDGINEVRVILNGGITVKRYSGAVIKAIMTRNGMKPSTGFYSIFFVDPKLGGAPIPCDALSSFLIQIDLAAGGAGVQLVVTPTLYEGFKESFPLALDRILCERYARTKNFGTDTGDQEVDLERTQDTLGWMFDLDDNGTRSDTVFSKISIEGKNRNTEDKFIDEMSLVQLKEMNTEENNGNALPTGIFAMDIPEGLPSYNYTTLQAILYIPTAATKAQAKVVERYLMTAKE